MRTAVLALMVGLTVLSASPAHADRIPVNEGGNYAPCVTYTEYQAIHFGMSRGEVRRTLDTDGHRVSRQVMDVMAGQVPVSPGNEVVRPTHLMDRHYRGCVDELNPHGADIYVEFNIRTDRATSFAWF